MLQPITLTTSFKGILPQNFRWDTRDTGLFGKRIVWRISYIFIENYPRQILRTFSFVWFGFMAYQSLLVISCQILFIQIYEIYMICKYILLIAFLNELKLNLLLSVKWFQVLLYITNNSIKHQSFVCTQLNYQTVQFSISHLFALSLNVKCCIGSYLSSISHLFALSLNVKYCIGSYLLVI